MVTNADKVLAMVKDRGLVRTGDVVAVGIPRVTLTRMVEAGVIERVARGLYALPDADVTEHRALMEACKRVPHGVICLLSALRFHELTTQAPHEVWLAIETKARKPAVGSPPLRIVRCSREALTAGVEVHDIEGIEVPVTTPARTVADCFKYRNKLGVDVAIEALRDFRREKSGTIDELWAAAAAARVRSVIRPYLEALA